MCVVPTVQLCGIIKPYEVRIYTMYLTAELFENELRQANVGIRELKLFQMFDV